MEGYHPIGVFDSGYGGLTVFRAIADKLPQYDYVYLGDNGRAPYGSRATETVYQYTLQCVRWFFDKGCPLVILACNTASARALRMIQQNDLPRIAPDKRVLGVIRPTAEVIGAYTHTGSVGVLGTKGTISSGAYEREAHKFFPDVRIHPLACPMWVPLVENGEYLSDQADHFVKKNLEELMAMAPDIDTVLLACTHYPLLMDKIVKYLPEGITIVQQGDITANSLADYLRRHPDMEARISRGGQKHFYTTDDTADFDNHGTTFFGEEVRSEFVQL